MSNPVRKGNHSMDADTISLISKRYKAITKAINEDFWDSSSETLHNFYVGSYGRGTAIGTSDLDVLFELPDEEYEHFTSLSGNGQSRLLQDLKNTILDTYSRSDVKADGQVVVIEFSDEMKFEILPAFRNVDWFGNWDGTYKYPDTHMGGNWMSTNPKAEQKAMSDKNGYYESNGLLKDTCKHIRYIKSENSSYHLSGILIDSFVYAAIGGWHFLRDGEKKSNNIGSKTFEQHLLDFYNNEFTYMGITNPILYAPGSGMKIDCKDWDVLGKVLNKMV